MKRFLSLFATTIAMVVVLAGCDATGSEETAIFNADSPFPPTVEYDFVYDADNVNSSGQVEVTSRNEDNLTSILSDNGFERGDVRSARVDSVVLERISLGQSTGAVPKVFRYLTGAEVFLGADETGTRIADDNFSTEERTVRLGGGTRDVTDVVRGGSTKAFLRLDTDEEVTEQDRVEVTVYFRIEARV